MDDFNSRAHCNAIQQNTLHRFYSVLTLGTYTGSVLLEDITNKLVHFFVLNFGMVGLEPFLLL